MNNLEAATPVLNPNIDFWHTVLVPKFVRWRHILVDGLAQHSSKVFPSLSVRLDDKVIDIGCGFGDTAIHLAGMVGPGGSVTGVDCCDEFLEYGRRDARITGLANVHFLEADVETCPFRPEYDFCFSRFGTQFFASPVAGLQNMRTSLKPGGIMTMIVWRGIEDNPWLGRAKQIVLQHLPPAPAKAQSCGPGPFSMADPDLVSIQLEHAGYRDIKFQKIDAPVLVGKNLDDAVAFQLAIGPAGEVYREAGQIAEQRRPQIIASLKAELSRYVGPNGVTMDSSSWKITAGNSA